MTALTQWKPGESANPAGRPARSAAMVEGLAPHRDALLTKLIELGKAGDTKALRIIFDRIAPPLRAESPPVHIPKLIEARTMPEKAIVIIDAVADGSISPDVAERLLGALAHAGQIIELERLARDVDELKLRDLI
ncbi:MAG: hypothetical protein HZB40_16700 [Rhodocyclales bacterium]|nr:hypothetical protein [Rhodocyclales bacterium]